VKAIIQTKYAGPDALRLGDIAIPEPKTGQLRVRVLACAVNLSDWEYLIGAPFYARMVAGLRRPKNPVLGSDIVGIIDKIGPDVSGFTLGQRVMGDLVMERGGFAEYACVKASEMVEIPGSLTDEIAACLPQAGGIAVAGAELLKPGDRLLINGAGGGSGTMALQLAKARGAHVTAVDNAEKIGWLRELGADAVIDYRVTDFCEPGQTWVVIIDMVATRGPRRIARALSPGGRYKALGGSVGVLLSLVFGGWLFRSKGGSIGMLIVPSGAALTSRVAALVTAGDLSPHLAGVMPLSKTPDALAATGRGAVKGKLVIKPDAPDA
jgi:NADPH:quinone reductase-like Zn-dependent oxidoreductase